MKVDPRGKTEIDLSLKVRGHRARVTFLGKSHAEDGTIGRCPECPAKILGRNVTCGKVHCDFLAAMDEAMSDIGASLETDEVIR